MRYVRSFLLLICTFILLALLVLSISMIFSLNVWSIKVIHERTSLIEEVRDVVNLEVIVDVEVIDDGIAVAEWLRVT